MKNTEKQHYKELLKSRKNSETNLLESIENSFQGKNSKDSISELSSYDNHPADIASEVFQIEHARGLKIEHEDDLRKIEEAYNRLETNSFGICSECSTPIDRERLEILPETTLCIDCARKMDSQIEDARNSIRHKPPTDDSILTPFGDKPVIDKLTTHDSGMDIFEDLIEFGSAETDSEA